MKFAENRKVIRILACCFGVFSCLFFWANASNAANVSGTAAIFSTSASHTFVGKVFFNLADFVSLCDKESNNYIDLDCGGNNMSDTYADYGVTIANDGTFSGYAFYYMGNGGIIGYLDFDHLSDTVGCAGFGGTNSVNCKAYLQSWQVLGWAKASSANWVDFNDSTTINGMFYSINVYLNDSGTLNVKDFHDKAILLKSGDPNFAYFISFNCNEGYGSGNVCASPAGNYKVQYNSIAENQKPTVTLNDPDMDPAKTWCVKTEYPFAPDEGKVSISWNYADDNSAQSDYIIQISTDSTFTNSSAIKECEFNDNAGNTSQFIARISPLVGCSPIYINYNTTYHWRLRVKDGTEWSDWSAHKTFTTPIKPLPYISFTVPKNPRADANLTFTDQSKCFDNSLIEKNCDDGSFNSEVSYEWDFSEGLICTAVEQAKNKATCRISTKKGDADHKYDSTSNDKQFPAILTITQGADFCDRTIPVGVGKPFSPPSWTEIAPF